MKRYSNEDVVGEMRKRTKWPKTQTDLSMEIGFSRPVICGVLSGHLPVTERLANALGFEKLPDAYVRRKP